MKDFKIQKSQIFSILCYFGGDFCQKSPKIFHKNMSKETKLIIVEFCGQHSIVLVKTWNGTFFEKKKRSSVSNFLFPYEIASEKDIQSPSHVSTPCSRVVFFAKECRNFEGLLL